MSLDSFKSRLLSWAIGLASLFGWFVIYNHFGQRPALRYWGALATIWACFLLLRPALPFYFGSRQVTVFRGWRKVLVLLPALAMGVAVLLFPDQIACSVGLRGYSCP